MINRESDKSSVICELVRELVIINMQKNIEQDAVYGSYRTHKDVKFDQSAIFVR